MSAHPRVKIGLVEKVTCTCPRIPHARSPLVTKRRKSPVSYPVKFATWTLRGGRMCQILVSKQTSEAPGSVQDRVARF